MNEPEMQLIAQMIASVVREPNSDEVKARVRREVAELTARFPLYPSRYKQTKVEAIAAD
jgi:glycine/serine hydroxymethyltransferase